jgi:hypothetical protein
LEKPKKTRAKPRKPGPNCKGFWRWKGIYVILEKFRGIFSKRTAVALFDRYKKV